MKSILIFFTFIFSITAFSQDAEKPSSCQKKWTCTSQCGIYLQHYFDVRESPSTKLFETPVFGTAATAEGAYIVMNQKCKGMTIQTFKTKIGLDPNNRWNAVVDKLNISKNLTIYKRYETSEDEEGYTYYNKIPVDLKDCRIE